MNLIGGQLSGVVTQGGIIQRKMFEGQKCRGNCLTGNFIGVTVQGGNYSGVILWKEKSGDG